MDDIVNWELLAASENATHTYLKVGRQWNTCDTQDVVIGVSFPFIFIMALEDLIFKSRSTECVFRRVQVILFGQSEMMTTFHIMERTDEEQLPAIYWIHRCLLQILRSE